MQPAVVSTEKRLSKTDVSIHGKRKRAGSPHQSVSTSPDLNSNIRQQSAHQLFPATGKTADNSRISTDINSSFKKARLKTLHAASDPADVTQHMYSFTSKHPSNDVVDLTTSPPNNGRPRTISGIKPVRNGLNPNLGAKKLVVKNLRKQSEWNPEEYFEKTWVRLDEALSRVFSQPNAQNGLSMEDLYRSVENLCRQGKASSVNTRLNDRCTKHLISIATSLDPQTSQDDVRTLQAVLAAWQQWTAQVVLIRCIFYYMDRSYLLSQSKTNLNDVCTASFRKIVFEESRIKAKVIEGACELFTQDRRGVDVDRSTIKKAISMFHDLGVYSSSFEPRFLARSQQYITFWVGEAASRNNLSEYVTGVVELMRREGERCDLLGLDTTTRRDLVAQLQHHAIEAKVDFLVDEKSTAQLLDKNDAAILEQLYKLLKRRQLGARLKPSFAKWIEATGTSIIFDDEAQDDMIVRLLSLKKGLDTLWNTSFQRDVDLGHGMREAFETFMNKTKKGASTWGTDNSKTGEMIAKYVDMLLRDGSKVIPSELNVTKRIGADDDDGEAGMDEDAEVNAQLDQVLDLFRFIQGKAVFEAFYKKDLAKRLLMGRSASADAERSMLTRLKTECGAGFTQNLEQMFKDVELGREEMSGYKDRLDAMQQKPGSVDLSVNVLSAAAWPSYPDVPVTIPPHIHTAIEAFERYYQVKHSGRKLSWKHALAHCQMKAAFPKGTKEFVVSSFQAIVLLLFNSLAEQEKLSYEHIKTVSGLPEPEVKRTLQSLACAKLRPLTKHPLGKDINDGDTFSVNTSFHHPRYRVRINQVQLKETKQENKETHERVAEDRNFECQAAIVRIMKSRKTIGHSELVAEVITATRSRGVLAVADIKKNIDRLIEKDYMEREDGNTYAYVA